MLEAAVGVGMGKKKRKASLSSLPPIFASEEVLMLSFDQVA